jgi:hypothetical protein
MGELFMKVYFVANERKVCATVEEAVSQACYCMGLGSYKNDERYVVSKPMVIENRWGEKRLVVSIYDTKYNKLKIKRRKIDVINFFNANNVPKIEYLGNL